MMPEPRSENLRPGGYFTDKNRFITTPTIRGRNNGRLVTTEG